MRITYYYPNPDAYSGDWDWDASLEKLEGLVRAAVAQVLPTTTHTFASTIGGLDGRPERIYVESDSLSYACYDVRYMVAEYLGALAQAIEDQPDKWLVPAEPKLKPCPFCGGEARLITGELPVLGPVYLIECSECGATHGVLEEYPAKKWNNRV